MYNKTQQKLSASLSFYRVCPVETRVLGISIRSPFETLTGHIVLVPIQYHVFSVPWSCLAVFLCVQHKIKSFCIVTGTFVCESCFSEHSSKHTYLLPGKNSWIIILHFPNSQTLLLCTDPGSWPDYAVCLFTNNILPSSLCSRSLFTVSWVRSRPDDAASSSPAAKTDVSYSPTEFTAAKGEFIKALLKNKNILKKYIHCFASGI